MLHLLMQLFFIKTAWGSAAETFKGVKSFYFNRFLFFLHWNICIFFRSPFTCGYDSTGVDLSSIEMKAKAQLMIYTVI